MIHTTAQMRVLVAIEAVDGQLGPAMLLEVNSNKFTFFSVTRRCKRRNVTSGCRQKSRKPSMPISNLSGQDPVKIRFITKEWSTAASAMSMRLNGMVTDAGGVR